MPHSHTARRGVGEAACRQVYLEMDKVLGYDPPWATPVTSLLDFWPQGLAMLEVVLELRSHPRSGRGLGPTRGVQQMVRKSLGGQRTDS